MKYKTIEEGYFVRLEKGEKLMETLGALKETARDGLQQGASIEADIDAVVAEPPVVTATDRPSGV